MILHKDSSRNILFEVNAVLVYGFFMLNISNNDKKRKGIYLKCNMYSSLDESV